MLSETLKKEKVVKDTRKFDITAYRDVINGIDPEHITAYIAGDEEFPLRMFRDDKISESAYGVDLTVRSDIAIFIVLEGAHLRAFGNQVYLCEHNIAFSDSEEFIEQDEDPGEDPYLSGDILTWDNMVLRLIHATNAHRNGIPSVSHLLEILKNLFPPPKEVYY